MSQGKPAKASKEARPLAAGIGSGEIAAGVLEAVMVNLEKAREDLANERKAKLKAEADEAQFRDDAAAQVAAEAIAFNDTYSLGIRVEQNGQFVNLTKRGGDMMRITAINANTYQPFTVPAGLSERDGMMHGHMDADTVSRMMVNWMVPPT